MTFVKPENFTTESEVINSFIGFELVIVEHDRIDIIIAVIMDED